MLYLFHQRVSLAQQIEYIYENAGNRVLRQIYVMRSNPYGDNQLKNGEMADQQFSDTTGTYDFKLYPNPTRDVLNIESCESFLELPGKSISVYELTGKLLVQKQVEDRSTKIDLSNAVTGQYIVRMTSDNKKIREWKVIKE